jgi:hypothetical protein
LTGHGKVTSVEENTVTFNNLSDYCSSPEIDSTYNELTEKRSNAQNDMLLIISDEPSHLCENSYARIIKYQYLSPPREND